MVSIRRCAAVVKGGRRFSFNALVVVGNGRGQVGWGYGKANEVPPAVEKGVKDAHKQMKRVNLRGGTIPHAVIGHYGAAKVLLMPASPGTGVIAGGAVRAVVQSAGVKDILTKSFGSNNKLNLVKAAIDALLQLANQGRDRSSARSAALMQLHDVHQGIHRRKKRKRIGRGIGSGHGKTSSKGHKGHASRQGFKLSPIFEGGQMPLARRVPKRGFVNGAFKKSYAIVNLDDLEAKFEPGAVVDETGAARQGAGQGPRVRRHQDPGRRRADQAAGSARHQVQRLGRHQDRRRRRQDRRRTVQTTRSPRAAEGQSRRRGSRS